MPIKAIKLRAGFLLLLFTLLFISSNSLITQVNAESLEESFKNTPLPFWEIETENTSVSYNEYSSNVLFSTGEYSEFFIDASNWGVSSNEGTETITSDGNIGTCLYENDASPDTDYYYSQEISMSWDIGNFFMIRYRMNETSGYDYPIYLLDEDGTSTATDRWKYALTESISWRTDIFNYSDYVDVWGAEDIVETILIGIRSYSVQDMELQIDYIMFGYWNGTINTSIPITEFTNQKLEFMLDTRNLTMLNKIDFGIYKNLESMNYNFSIQNNIFIQRDFTFNYSEHNYLRFVLDLKYSTNYFKISVYDENNSKLFSNIIYDYVRKTGNNFRILANDFSGWFYLYYFTGDVDYSSTWIRQPLAGSPYVEDSLLSASALDNDILDTYETRYTQYVTNFQFLRTNMYMWTEHEYTADLDYIECKIRAHFYYPNGTIQYLVTEKFYRTAQFMYSALRVYQGDEWTVPIYTSFASLTGSNIMEETIQFAVWRTQENFLGTFHNVPDTWTVRTDSPTRFVSNMTLENFQGNVSIMYRVTDLYNSDYRNFVIELDGFEFGYGSTDGVAEPHFSTTWWESIPLIGAIVGALITIGNSIGLLIEAGFTPINILLDSIFGAIGGVAGSVWVLFESALDNLGISIDAVASDVFGFFDGILTSIAGVIDDLYTAIINLNDNFVAWVIEGITDALVPALVAGIDSMMDALFALWEYQLNLVGTALGWGTVGTFLFDFTESVALTIPSWLAFMIDANILMVDTFVWVNAMYIEYGATFLLYAGLFVVIDILSAVMTTNLDKIGECIGKYIKVVVWMAEFMLNIISTVLNAIWGLLPF